MGPFSGTMSFVLWAPGVLKNCGGVWVFGLEEHALPTPSGLEAKGTFRWDLRSIFQNQVDRKQPLATLRGN